jgi:hypothetical protein
LKPFSRASGFSSCGHGKLLDFVSLILKIVERVVFPNPINNGRFFGCRLNSGSGVNRPLYVGFLTHRRKLIIPCHGTAGSQFAFYPSSEGKRAFHKGKLQMSRRPRSTYLSADEQKQIAANKFKTAMPTTPGPDASAKPSSGTSAK